MLCLHKSSAVPSPSTEYTGDVQMIMSEVKTLEEALEKEGRIQQRQALLKRLWKVRQGLTEEGAATKSATTAEQTEPHVPVRRAS